MTAKLRYMYALPEQLHLNPPNLENNTFKKLEIVVMILRIPIQLINPMQRKSINLTSITSPKHCKVVKIIRGYITFDNISYSTPSPLNPSNFPIKFLNVALIFCKPPKTCRSTVSLTATSVVYSLCATHILRPSTPPFNFPSLRPWTISFGEMTLPRDFDIFSRSLSRTKPCVMRVLKGEMD